ncbi:MAG: DNA repair protein RecN [Chitinophagales bacterium]|nr:DNA repair protein RecN [Chitinophagales bacterium]MDW8428706.1 DNA repair protein RecN [Chitinophagales bacterium]
MLLRLAVSNYVIIDALELQFSEGLNVITGETGAGKSIVVEALMLVLGERADTTVLREAHRKCVIEAEFTRLPEEAEALLQQADVDHSDPLLLRREILPYGKSRFFVNDTPVPAALLRQLKDLLVDLHHQHDSIEVAQQPFQLAVLDSLAAQEAEVHHYRHCFGQYRRDMQRLEQLNQQQANADLDYLAFQLEELNAAALTEGEQEKLEQEQQQLLHAEQIIETLQQALHHLSDAEDNLLSRLYALRQQLRSLTSSLSETKQLLERLDSVHQELNDIAGEFSRLLRTIQPDPQRLQEISDRLDVIYRLQKKHRVQTVGELLHCKQQLQQQITQLQDRDKERELLAAALRQQQQQLLQLADTISRRRAQQIPTLLHQINTLLVDVGMPHARIDVRHQRLPSGQFNSYGIDQVQFLFAPNQGSVFQEIGRIASGGELSRLMLCFKSLVAAETKLPTLIFDEIDSGISGETAMKVARLLRRLADKHQVICITHLPQLAARGESHFQVSKKEVNGRTQAFVRPLNKEEKIETIARMISGHRVTAAALASARELLENY